MSMFWQKKYDFLAYFCSKICIYQKNVVILQPHSVMEAGVNPAQTRCCDSQ